MINRFLVIFIMITMLLLSACGKEKYYPSQEAALEDFIQSEEIKGSIDLIVTTNGDELVVVQQDEKSYFIGELVERKNEYRAKRISDLVTMEIGGGWELKTSTKHKYTIYFEENQENQNFFRLSNENDYMSLVDGHQISKEASIVTNAIKEMNLVKE